MNDVKLIVSVIKILERTIGVLENCNDVGKISDVTRKRVIEMLNKATLEIYFLDNGSLSETVKEPEKEQVIEMPVTANVVEETVADITDKIQPAVETITEEYVEENVPEIVPEEESIDIVPEKDKFVPEEETLADEEVFEEENVVENVADDNTVAEDSIFMRDSLLDKPLFEWEIDSSEPVREQQETQEPQEANKEDEINILKLQLEEERKRLEQELQNWQDEKRKRDEEILAAKKLLESLQQQAAVNQTKQPPVQKPAPQQPVQPQPAPQRLVQPQSQPVSQSNQSSRQVQQPQQPAKKEPFIRTESAKKEETQGAIIDRFIGTKKVLHENFETSNMVNQISTPVSSLPKSIGINDRFRFIKELFGGDSDLYNETIKKLDNIGSLVSAISYIESNFSWDKNSDSVKQLISLIRRRYM
ncbi:MAG: hypothetical protein LBE04_03670 [Prevotellaceae bacterium]|jgi:hypothetical protein|nr:hypothetical protein [Prevotellaceae bacterium]